MTCVKLFFANERLGSQTPPWKIQWVFTMAVTLVLPCFLYWLFWKTFFKDVLELVNIVWLAWLFLCNTPVAKNPHRELLFFSDFFLSVLPLEGLPVEPERIRRGRNRFKRFMLSTECLQTFPHCRHLPFSDRRWTQWWWVVVCSLYCLRPTSLKVGLQVKRIRSIRMGMQLWWLTTLHAEHFIRGPCFCNNNKSRLFKKALLIDTSILQVRRRQTGVRGRCL